MKIALTGHRPERLGTNTKEIKNWIKETLLSENATEVYCGMADGGDILLALAVIELKRQYHYNIKLNCILPCKNYGRRNENYNYIKENADSWIELQDKYTKDCNSKRDLYMVEHCDKLIALWDKLKVGGVYNTINMAKERNKEIIYCPVIKEGVWKKM